MRTQWHETEGYAGREREAVHETEGGIPCARVTARLGDFVTREHFNTAEELNVWIRRGVLRKVGTTTQFSAFDMDPGFLEELQAEWLEKHPEPPPRETLYLEPKNIIGAVTSDTPFVYEAIQAFDGMEEGARIAVSAMWQGSWRATGKRIHELIQGGLVRVVAKWIEGKGFVACDNDPFSWTRGPWRMNLNGGLGGYEEDQQEEGPDVNGEAGKKTAARAKP